MKTFYSFAAAALMFSVVSCGRETALEPCSPEQLKYEQDMNTIREMGYDTSEAFAVKDGYVVEGDILLTSKHLEDFLSAPQTRHTRNGNYFVGKDLQILYVTYGGPNFNEKIFEAMEYWNENAQCNIVFDDKNWMHKISIREEVLWTYNGDVLDTPDEETLLVVSPPFSTGEPGDIVINTACRYLPSGEQAMYMLLHAFGHAFGFGHTPESPGDKGDGSYIEGTAEYDPASIMVRESDPLRWSGFSENDIKAFKAVYPTDEPEPEPEPEVDFSDRSMEWIADDGFAIAMGGPYAYGSVNIDVRVRLTGSEWADGQVRGMRIYDLYTGEEVMRGKAGSCRLQPGEYTLHYGAAVRREDGTFECRYGTADFEVTLPGFELTMPILSHPEDIDLSRTIVVRCSFETDDAAWRNFSCSVQLVNLRTGEEITHQSYTPNERWAFRLTERGTYRAVATVSNGSETLVIRKDFVLPELTNPKDIYHTLNWRAIDFDKVIQYYIDFYSDEACTEKLSLQHSAACHYIVWRRHHDAEGNPTKNDKVMEDTVMLPAGVTTYNLPYTFEAKDYLTLHGYRYDYEIVGIEYR
ncbi:hypothetical protein [Tidjanibacter massiliensis]|uniref:hypothetical protein n=2 Tax=Rikenellaceae TaxID=171550 RepID=UPI000AD86561|nr:hypothetical protein [Tidjanibacter massiliensis]